MSKTDAAYMKAYRARRKAAASVVLDDPTIDAGWLQWDCPACGQSVRSARIPGSDGRAKIADLEAEVKHLKAELAKRAEPVNYCADCGKKHIPVNHTNTSGSFNSRPFTPAPKK